MTTSPKRKNRDQEGKFFLYVIFHSVFSAIVNLFNDD